MPEPIPPCSSTRAERDGDEWVINGHKWFSSNASISDFLIVMCLTNPDVEAYRRYSMIIVPTRTPGVNILRDVPTMGEPDHRTGEPGGHAEIIYDDVRVPYENLIGNLGDGFALAQKRLGPGRIHHAMRWLGQSRRAFDMLCERALSRFTHGSLLAEKQMIQDWIAESHAEMQAARLLTLEAAWKMDRLHESGRHYSDARIEIATIKFWGARVLYNVIDRAIQVHGSLGYTTDLPLGVDVPGGPGGAHLRRTGRGAQGHRGPPGAQALQGGRGTDRARAHPPPAGAGEVRRPPRRPDSEQLGLRRRSPLSLRRHPPLRFGWLLLASLGNASSCVAVRRPSRTHRACVALRSASARSDAGGARDASGQVGLGPGVTTGPRVVDGPTVVLDVAAASEAETGRPG